MFVVMVDIDIMDDYYYMEYSGIKYETYPEAEEELYEARKEGLTAYIQEV